MSGIFEYMAQQRGHQGRGLEAARNGRMKYPHFLTRHAVLHETSVLAGFKELILAILAVVFDRRHVEPLSTMAGSFWAMTRIFKEFKAHG